MNIDAFALPTDINQVAVRTALEGVAGLVTVAATGLCHEAQTQLASLLLSGASVDVHFRLLHGRALVTATIEDIPFFSVEVGGLPPKEEAHH